MGMVRIALVGILGVQTEAAAIASRLLADSTPLVLLNRKANL
jgi:hypothetical protein